MFYLDTSIVIAVLLKEPESARVEAALAKLDANQIALSGWTGVETFSAIGRQERTKHLNAKTAEMVRRLYREEFQEKQTLLPVAAADFVQAQSWIARSELGLRSGDALHLAIATRHAVTLYTLDKTLLKAGREMGLAVATF